MGLQHIQMQYATRHNTKTFISRITGEEMYIPMPKNITHVPGLRDVAQTIQEENYQRDTDQLYSLRMMESAMIDKRFVQRVPGGWVFIYTAGTCFVPYVDEEEIDEYDIDKQTKIKL